MDTHTTLQLNSETDSDPEVDIISIYIGGGRVLMKITQLHPTLCLGSGFFIFLKKFPLQHITKIYVSSYSILMKTLMLWSQQINNLGAF